VSPGRHPLRAITLSVVVMHAAALAWVATAPDKPAHPVASGPKARVMQTRLASAEAARPANAAPPDTAAPVAATSPETSSAPLPTPPAVAEAQAEAPPSPPPTETVAAAHAEPLIPPDAFPAETAQTDNGDNYLPRPLLTAAPRPSAPVILPFPQAIGTPGRYATILALFIDEGGVVRRVRIDGPALPKPLEDAARDTFLQTHFRPGEVQGQQVKSLIRIEVVFDNTPTKTGSASRSL
jgi:hypothetical protein